MSDTVIRVENLGKKYIIGHQQQERYTALRDVLVNRAKDITQIFNPKAKRQKPNSEEFWALKDVSFEVKRGDRIGIIGRNGAGKSTLLKVLSRITEPTEGRISIKGRVASLLEVGTGFHPELTGRENIYLNGAILGMSKVDIRRQFDEIVAFAEVEKFLDTPVKRYSSGMYVRLAFAVAAHLEPEILVVDEVLAVGDAAFQKKCLGKMEDVAENEGRTVLFVSHNMAAVEKLCRKGFFLRQGQVMFSGKQSETITQYLTSSVSESGSLKDRRDRKGSGEAKIVNIEIKNTEGDLLEIATSGQTIDIYLYFESASINLSRVIASIMIRTQLDVPVFLQHNRLTQDDFGALPKNGAFVCRIEKLPLPPSSYNLTYSLIRDGAYLDSLSDALELSVVDGDFYGSGEVPPISTGVCLVNAKWRLEN
ncbi:ABC transporter ATP-binding protein [Phormidium tenue]|uniref:ABC transporter ATP-binding protein n=1 Tax=Phormidium tenue NIES-30 TaxID=549789 RepID=A0A1U7JBG9_9CYAN|nr:ABC transporter ATP-binding protein [Phormidium tenue]MBD2230078.1 ABC transporter ATP-binding protein [Phormidium tenue FACHB-1052]OKH51083.1 ABC transporter ATP-binding protein [Phormidium tenue NIES-30]